jgi:hypothetical protein
MPRQVGSELASIGQHRIQLAIEALHQLLGPLLEFSIRAAAVAKIGDGDPVDELATWIELGDEGIDLARIEGECGCHEGARYHARGGPRGVTVTCLQLAWCMLVAPRPYAPAGTVPRR